MSFYRIYRPQIISEIDNISVREQLLSLLTKNKKDLPHAYLFEGPKGSGKTTAARIIAKLFNCRKPTGTGPCGKCPSCLSIAAGSNIDVLEIDAASNRGIDDVRELRDKIKLSPASDPYKVYIVDEVHMMTTEAFNALLKTLEEPPPHAVFILATTDPQKVPVTVRSRCMEIRFAKAKKEELLSALSRIAKKEKISIQDDGLEIIAETADGAFRDAVKMLEQISFYKGRITEHEIKNLLSKSDEKKRVSFLTSVLDHKDGNAALDAIHAYVGSGGDIKIFTKECLADLQKQLLQQIQGGNTLWSKQSIQNFTRRLMISYGELRTCPIPELPLELAVVEFLEEGDANDGKTGESKVYEKSSAQVPSKKSGAISDEHPMYTTTNDPVSDVSDHLDLEKLTAHWSDFIEALKPLNHSVAGVVRGSRPKSVEHGVVTIEAFYTFHQERLSDARVRDILATVLKKLFGVKVRVEIVLGRK